MPKWKKEVHRLPKNHGWKAKDGWKIFVADQGAVSFNYPGNWIVGPGEGGAIKFINRQPPDDDWTLQISVMHLAPEIDWSGLPVPEMLQEALKGDDRFVLDTGEVQVITRPGAEIAWLETRFFAENENRDAFSRACLARGGLVVPFITLDFWPEHREQLIPIWDEILTTLQLNRKLTLTGPPRIH